MTTNKDALDALNKIVNMIPEDYKHFSADDLIDTIRSSLVNTTWQDIANCPKDRTWFLGECDGVIYKYYSFLNNGVVNYNWAMHTNMASGQTLRIEKDDNGKQRKVQIKEADEPSYQPHVLAYKCGMDHKPTKWMPLPPTD